VISEDLPLLIGQPQCSSKNHIQTLAVSSALRVVEVSHGSTGLVGLVSVLFKLSSNGDISLVSKAAAGVDRSGISLGSSLNSVSGLSDNETLLVLHLDNRETECGLEDSLNRILNHGVKLVRSGINK